MQPASALASLVLAVLLVAAVVALLLHVLFAGAARLRRRGAERVLRRCDACGRGWKAAPGRELSVLGLRVRRWARRRASGDDKRGKWFSPQGWSRCPSCLSTRVRTTGDPPTEAVWTSLEKAGVVAGSLGVVLVLLALVGLVL